MSKEINPMQAFLAGWLMAAISTHKEPPMNIVGYDVLSPKSFQVTLSGGLALEVNVEVKPRTSVNAASID
ncbi:hypothetical protein [Sphingomonas sp.]|uniref:hypothetical protein n=1 Tax=Sphingomonas sp. TaxID=28214 RepID=UPI0025DA41B5|nr:hypothetical protein [Sphingomonas sp.]